MKNFLFCLWQWIWGFPQSLLGFIFCLRYRNCPHERYHGAVVTHWPIGGSLGVGMFLFIGQGDREQLLIHEFGHSVQSLILGPLFLPIMGIPSFLWANLPWTRRLRKEKGVSYYRFYPEKNANWLGAKVTGKTCTLK